MEYFDWFELPVNLKVNKAQILKKYYALLKIHHPDNFSLQAEKEQNLALEQSAKINKAKEILDDAYLRLGYILTQKGWLNIDEKYALSPAFLGEMMDINEQLMDLSLDPNPALSQSLRKQIIEKDHEIYEAVSNYFDMEDLSQLTEQDFLRLKEYYFKRKYLSRLQEGL